MPPTFNIHKLSGSAGNTVGLIGQPLTPFSPQEAVWGVVSNGDDASLTEMPQAVNDVISVNSWRQRFRVLPPPDPVGKNESFRVMQKWQGYVLETEQNTFHARLTPIVGEDGDQEAQIYLEEVDDEDRDLVEPGAVFYWSIGYFDQPSGRSRVSAIRFRRLPIWTKKDMKSADENLTRLRGLFGVK